MRKLVEPCENENVFSKMLKKESEGRKEGKQEQRGREGREREGRRGKRRGGKGNEKKGKCPTVLVMSTKDDINHEITLPAAGHSTGQGLVALSLSSLRFTLNLNNIFFPVKSLF